MLFKQTNKQQPEADTLHGKYQAKWLNLAALQAAENRLLEEKLSVIFSNCITYPATSKQNRFTSLFTVGFVIYWTRSRWRSAVWHHLPLILLFPSCHLPCSCPMALGRIFSIRCFVAVICNNSRSGRSCGLFWGKIIAGALVLEDLRGPFLPYVAILKRVFSFFNISMSEPGQSTHSNCFKTLCAVKKKNQINTQPKEELFVYNAISNTVWLASMFLFAVPHKKKMRTG